jgi:hypothetical protein
MNSVNVTNNGSTIFYGILLGCHQIRRFISLPTPRSQLSLQHRSGMDKIGIISTVAREQFPLHPIYLPQISAIKTREWHIGWWWSQYLRLHASGERHLLPPQLAPMSTTDPFPSQPNEESQVRNVNITKKTTNRSVQKRTPVGDYILDAHLARALVLSTSV